MIISPNWAEPAVEICFEELYRFLICLATFSQKEEQFVVRQCPQVTAGKPTAENVTIKVTGVMV